MRLLEAIVDANHRLPAGEKSAGLPADPFRGALPLVALTCIDARLNRWFPDVLGIREEDFIWLRNAGNIIFDPMSSMTRTLALACAVKGGREIAIIGHTDCRVRATSVSDLIEHFRVLGIARTQLPDNLVEFFGLFASERQNVINAVAFVRQSPLIGPRIPVHGLLIDIQTGHLEWVVNGYQVLETALAHLGPSPSKAPAIGTFSNPIGTETGEIPSVPKTETRKSAAEKIGATPGKSPKWLGQVHVVAEGGAGAERAVTAVMGTPPAVPIPPLPRPGVGRKEDKKQS